MSNSLIEDIYDYEYDKYMDNLQNIVEDSQDYVCSCCGMPCDILVDDESFGFEYGSEISTQQDVKIISECCNAYVYRG